jgi:hypothetical protein
MAKPTSRDEMDLLWALVRAGERFGYESAQGGADRTRVDEAFRQRQQALANAMFYLEVKRDKGM